MVVLISRKKISACGATIFCFQRTGWRKKAANVECGYFIREMILAEEKEAFYGWRC